MEAIFPITALSKRPDDVKAAAREDVVRITERGEAAWIFASEEAYERRVREAVEEALYEAQLDAVVAKGLADLEAGRYVIGTQSAKEKLQAMREGR